MTTSFTAGNAGAPPPQTWADLLSKVISLVAAYTVGARPKTVLYLDNVAGFVTTLPVATGSGNVIDAFVKTTLTSGTYEIDAASGDTIGGTLYGNKGTTSTPYQATLGTTVKVSLVNAAVGAGIKGDHLRFRDVAPNVWIVEGDYWVSGTIATPFS